MSYTVTGRVGSKRKVEFSCPHCTATLNSPLEEAGQRFACPNCKYPLIVPGGEELRQQRASETAAAELSRAVVAPVVQPPVQEIAQISQSSTATPTIPQYAASPSTRQKTAGWLRRYRQRVGVRSYIFQVTLVGWTMLYLLWAITTAMSVSHAVSAFTSSLTPSPAPGFPAYARPAPTPGPGATEAIAGLLWGVMVGGAGWAIVGLPLFILAVATIDIKKEQAQS